MLETNPGYPEKDYSCHTRQDDCIIIVTAQVALLVPKTGVMYILAWQSTPDLLSVLHLNMLSEGVHNECTKFPLNAIIKA